MLNFQSLLTFSSAKSKFLANHPNVEPFIDELNSRDPEVGQEVAIAVRYPDGTECKTGVRITEDDMQLLELLRELLR